MMMNGGADCVSEHEHEHEKKKKQKKLREHVAWKNESTA
jgi:hypothetical protein